MRKAPTVVVAIFFAVMLLDTHTLSAAEQLRRVYIQYWKCLLENIDAYQALTSEPIIIYLPLCPKVHPTAEDFAATATNLHGLPSVKLSPISNVLVLSKQELKCIVINRSEIGRSVPPDQDKDLIELDFKKCK